MLGVRSEGGEVEIWELGSGIDQGLSQRRRYADTSNKAGDE